MGVEAKPSDETGRGEREVSLFRNGRSQAVRIPKEFEFDDDRVVMWKDPDGTIHMRPRQSKETFSEFLAWLATQPPINEDISEIEDYPPPDPVDLDIPE